MHAPPLTPSIGQANGTSTAATCFPARLMCARNGGTGSRSAYIVKTDACCPENTEIDVPCSPRFGSPDSRLCSHLLFGIDQLGLAPEQTGLLLLPQPVALALDVDGRGVMEQPVEDRRGQDLVVEDFPQSTKLLLLVTMRLARS